MDKAWQMRLEQERERLRESRTVVYVTKRCCGECILFPNKPFTDEQQQRCLTETLRDERFFECIRITIARRLNTFYPPEYVCCYGFFYQYHDRVSILKDALEDQRIQFLDIDGLPGLRESGLLICPPYWK
jgi:hypothetical protein